MVSLNIYYALALLVSAFLTAPVAVTAWRRRTAPGAAGLAIFMLGCVIWALTYCLRWLAVDRALQLFWLDATYLGVVTTTYGILLFGLEFTHRDHLLRRRNLLIFAIEPVLTLILLWTDGWHGLFFGGIRTTSTILNGGPWFWLHVVYSYSILLWMVVLIAREFIKATNLFRMQTGTLLAGLLLPMISNVISLSGLSPFKDLDITPFSFILTGLVLNYGLFRFHLLDILPVAYDRLIESLPDGVIVLDVRERIVEINPSARKMSGVTLDVIGKPVETVLGNWPEPLETYLLPSEFQQELCISQDPRVDMEIRILPLTDRRGAMSGALIVMRDITARKQVEEELKKMSLNDALTGLYNRTFFDAEIARLERGRQAPVSLLVVDIDELKIINDQQGHAAGDQFIRRAALVLNATFRGEDIITRIGGDEFVVILPNTTDQAAKAAKERLRRILHEHNTAQEDHPLGLSIGVHTAETTGMLAEAVKMADADMYRDKQERKISSRSHR